MLIGISPEYLYLHGEKPKVISDLHKPYFLVFSPIEINVDTARKELIKKWKNNKSSDDVLSKIEEIGEVESYRSFWDFGVNRNIFKVFTKKSYFVPEISDYLFFNQGLYTAEHDIPYQQRSLVDLAAQGRTWLFDTKGEKKKLKVLVYDIETSEFGEGKENIPIDIIGYSDFDIVFNSDKNLEKEEFSFDIIDSPSEWKNIEVKQLISRNLDEEIDNLLNFCKTIIKHDIISGHNIIGFDNFQIYNRLNWILKAQKNQLSDDNKNILVNFVNKYSRPDKSFYFGIHSEAVQFYPCSFDTYLGVRKFYSFLNDFSLKSVAPFLGVEVKDRIILTPSQIKIDDRTLKYNKQDVQEQLGVTLNLIQQALPLAFTTCMPFDTLLSSGAVNMWDHMSLIRAAIQKKIMPPICRVMSISQVLLKFFKGYETREEIVRQSKKIKEQLSKDFVRVIKYGYEMPKWMEYPYVIYNENTTDPDERLNYHMPGGMTIKPDKEAFSHFIPWWYVIVADVGAMYPTILKAMNIGADTVRAATESEKPDDYIWLKKIPKQFFDKRNVNWRKITKDDSYADKGYILGIKIDEKPGIVNCAMTGIMSMIAKIKSELNEVNKSNNKKELQRLKMMYQSIKGARNAGTHGILSAPLVSGRQFNLWAAAAITTKGQAILADTLNYFKKRDIRVIYGDSVSSDTDIIVKEADLIKIVNIKSLFEEHDNPVYKKGTHEYKKLNNIKCLSVAKDGIYKWKNANFVKRHPHINNIVSVKTQRGIISVTKNHSLYTLSEEFKEILCKDLNCKDTNIAHISKYNEKGSKIIINVLKPLKEFNNELNIILNIPLNNSTKNLLKYHQPGNNFKGKDSCYSYKIKNIRIKISDAINLYKKGIIKNKYLGNSYISSYNGKGKIPVIYELDEDFAKILGAYIAEGSIYIRNKKGMTKEGAHIFVCGHNAQSLEILKTLLIKKFNKKFNLTSAGFDKNGENFRIQGNSSTAFLYKFVIDCGQGCEGKKVSPFILSSNKEIQKAFIDEYVKGDGYYETKNRIYPLLGIQTKSKKLVEGLSIIGLNLRYGIPSIQYREEKKAYHLRFVKYNKDSKNYKSLTGLVPKTIEEIKPKDGYVYDISVQDNNNFVCASGLIIAHNTDGIYLGCSNSVGNVPDFSKSLGLSIAMEENKWLTNPKIAIKSIEECNNKWQNELNYPEFELESEIHGNMIFVKHKNYLIFDSKDDKIEMITKGNNFKGSDKADIARKTLKKIMIEVLKENPVWDDEEKARESVKNSIMSKTKEIVSKLDLTQVELDDLTLVQSVQPAKRYKLNQDGSISVFGKRSAALEKLIGQPIKSRIKLKFVVTKRPLPGITKPSKSGVKPIDYMYPVDFLKNKSEIDLDWYKKMIENYIQGAFGLSNIAITEQTGLDTWM